MCVCVCVRVWLRVCVYVFVCMRTEADGEPTKACFIPACFDAC